MHIVLDARFLRKTTGGIGRYTRALIRGLSHLDKDNQFTVLINPADRADWDELARVGELSPKQWRVQETDIPHYSYAEQIQLPRLLQELKPDLVHFTNFNHPLVWNQPSVVTIHDLTLLHFPVGRRQRSWIAQTAFHSIIRHALRKAKRVITVSEASKADLVKKFSARPKNIDVTYEGVDDIYQPINLPLRGRIQTTIQERFGVRSPYLLFVSQWRPHKGLPTLIEAYEIFRRSQTRLRPQLVIVGKPNVDFPEISQRIDRSDFAQDIVRPGFVNDEDLVKLYQGAAAFVFPSLYEGFGLTPLEAMACGTPVLASRASCMPEILGEAALFVEPKDPHAWAKALENILSDRGLWRQLRSAGLIHARQFSWEMMARQTHAIYQEALLDTSAKAPIS